MALQVLMLHVVALHMVVLQTMVRQMVALYLGGVVNDPVAGLRPS